MGRISSFLLKTGWVLMFVGLPLGSAVGAFPFLLAGKILGKRPEIEKDLLFFLVNIFILTSLFSILNSRNKLFVLSVVIQLFLMLYLVLLGAGYLLSKRGFLKKLVKVFILFSVFSGIYGTFLYFGRFEARARTLFTGENGLGTVMIPAIILTLACFTHTKGKKKLLAGFSLLIVLMGLLLSFSRGAWLGAGGGLLIYAICQKKDRLRVAALIAIVALIFFAYPPLVYRFNLIFNPSYPSNQERIYILKATWQMIKDHPITGVGMGNYPLVYPEYKLAESRIQNASFAHNIFIQIWAEGGIGTLAAFVGLVFLTLIKGARMRGIDDSFLRLVKTVSLASFAGILIHNQVDCTIYSMHIGPLFFLLAGIIFYSHKFALPQKRD